MLEKGFNLLHIKKGVRCPVLSYDILYFKIIFRSLKNEGSIVIFIKKIKS